MRPTSAIRECRRRPPSISPLSDALSRRACAAPALRIRSGLVAAARLPRRLRAARNLAQSTQTVSSAHRLFVFHSGLWINLHHFLYEQAAITTPRVPNGTPHEAELARDESMTSGLSEDERKTWLAAVAYYRANMLQARSSLGPHDEPPEGSPRR